MSRDESTSKLVTAIRRISRGAASPIGFGRAAAPTTAAMLLLAVLPRNDPALARAAIDAGADSVVVRLVTAAQDGVEASGDLASQRPAIEQIKAAIGDKPLGVMIGTEGPVRAGDYSALTQIGVDYVAGYPYLMPAQVLQDNHFGRGIIFEQEAGPIVRAINDLPIDLAFIRIVRKDESLAEMTVQDLAAFRLASGVIQRPIVALPTWQVAPKDLGRLRDVGIEAVALSAAALGTTAEDIGQNVRLYKEEIGRLGKPVGRSHALGEPAVLLPSVLGHAAEPNEEDRLWTVHRRN